MITAVRDRGSREARALDDQETYGRWLDLIDALMPGNDNVGKLMQYLLILTPRD